MNKNLQIGSLVFQSRLFLGSALFPSPEILREAIAESGAQMVTVAIRRVDLTAQSPYSLLPLLQASGVKLLPNTAGCRSAREAIVTAKLAQEALSIKQIKLEVIGNEYTLYPDGTELLQAARELVKDGFEVYPYCPDDPVLCQRLEDLGCVCVMPLAAPIGSGQGLLNPFNLHLICSQLRVPVIVDAGLGTASDATRAIECGASAVLVNSAIARAENPIVMAQAFRHAVEAGIAARSAGRIAKKEIAVPSTDDRLRLQLKRKLIR